MADIPPQELPRPIPAGGQPDQQNDEPTPTAPILRAELNIPASVVSQYQADQAKKNRFERWKLGVEIFTLAAISIYTWVAYHQLGQMRNATIASQKSADAAAYAARIAAKAYEDSKISSQKTLAEMQGQTTAQQSAANASASESQTTREALTSVQRAFINFTGFAIPTKTIVGNKTTELVLDLPWENDGVTPTKDAVGWINWEAIPNTMPANFDFPDMEKAHDLRQFVVPPKGFAHTTTKIPIGFIKPVQDGSTHLYVWGWMTYHDIFKGTATRLNEFCDEITNFKSSTGDITDPAANFTWDLSLCTVPHNCSDEECSDYKQKTKGR